MGEAEQKKYSNHKLLGGCRFFWLSRGVWQEWNETMNVVFRVLCAYFMETLKKTKKNTLPLKSFLFCSASLIPLFFLSYLSIHKRIKRCVHPIRKSVQMVGSISAPLHIVLYWRVRVRTLHSTLLFECGWFLLIGIGNIA